MLRPAGQSRAEAETRELLWLERERVRGKERAGGSRSEEVEGPPRPRAEGDEGRARAGRAPAARGPGGRGGVGVPGPSRGRVRPGRVRAGGTSASGSPAGGRPCVGPGRSAVGGKPVVAGLPCSGSWWSEVEFLGVKSESSEEGRPPS